MDNLINEIIEFRGCWKSTLEEAKLVATSMNISNSLYQPGQEREKDILMSHLICYNKNLMIMINKFQTASFQACRGYGYPWRSPWMDIEVLVISMDIMDIHCSTL